MNKVWKKLMGRAFLICPQLKYYSLCYMIGIGFTPFLFTYFLNVVTKQVSDPKSDQLWEFCIVIGFFFLCSVIVKVLSIYSESKADNRMTFVRMTIQNELSQSMFQLDYESLEDQNFLNQHHKVFESLGSSQVGVECLLKNMFYLSGLFFSIVSLSVVIGSKWVFLPFLFIGYLIVGVITASSNAKYQYSLEKERSLHERKIDYIYHTINDYAYIKEIKLFQVNVVLEEQFQDSISSMSHLFHKFKWFGFI